MLWLNIILLAFGFFMLIKGADWFVESASKIADKLGVSQLIIGLTIVAFGTSAPEAAVSITAAAGSAGGGSVDIAIGNVLGSNIMNILVILGITCIICPLAVQKSTRKIEIPFVIFITALTLGLGLSDGKIGKLDGAILLTLMVGFIVYLLIMAKKGQGSVEEGEEASADDKVPLLILLALIGGACIVFGSDITVAAATVIAKKAGMSEKMVGLTIVAFGTSLPELMTSIIAASKKKADIAIGNIVGSNIFNLLFVMALTAIVSPVALPYKNATTNFLVDNCVAIFAAVLLFIGVLNNRKRLERWCGVLMILSYAGYFTYLMLSQNAAL
ncbi:MAG: calcium/sodium antiporter [Lachnospiraceae bacterium]|nr:calcium/sodium antiporter [Lachnospiraceae bacterium]